MPARDAAGRRGRPPRLVELTLVALVFSWLGDSVPRLLDGDAAFLTMVSFFLVAQVVYIAAFWPARRRSAAVRACWSLPIYAAALVAVVAAQVLIAFAVERRAAGGTPGRDGARTVASDVVGRG
ncbi:lysoplasmalogenase family protein [Sanguibacter massiliensis]|uniref:lysoplasmalogenase family protein n=1 Tax=Sanguibacter massiliensis TaxID=1973217 RepID=UPI000C854229|nr:lysoplasmalogenase family protein [Sanguibacter massiliensis]